MWIIKACVLENMVQIWDLSATSAAGNQKLTNKLVAFA